MRTILSATLIMLSMAVGRAGDRQELYLQALERLEQKVERLQHQVDTLQAASSITVSDPLRATVITPGKITLQCLSGFDPHLTFSITGNPHVAATNTFTYTGNGASGLIWNGNLTVLGNLNVRSNITAAEFIHETNH